MKKMLEWVPKASEKQLRFLLLIWKTLALAATIEERALTSAVIEEIRKRLKQFNIERDKPFYTRCSRKKRVAMKKDVINLSTKRANVVPDVFDCIGVVNISPPEGNVDIPYM